MANVINQKESSKKNPLPKKELSRKRSTKSEPKKLTHIYMHSKFIDRMDKLSVSSVLTTLYLHDNLIEKIEGLQAAINLTHLYLQKNKLKKIENLNHLSKLRKLYLGHNQIAVVENLESLHELEELHLEKQAIAKSDSLCFDPRTMYSIGKSLQILNVSHNNIQNLEGIMPLRFLKYLNASHNKIETTKTICDSLQDMYYLYEAEFIGNPVSKVHLYREDIIKSTQRLACLDGKNINETTRCFIKRLDYEKSNFESRQSLCIGAKISGIANSYPPPLQKAVSASLIQTALRKSDSLDTSADTTTFIPWKSLPHASSDTTNRIPPLLRKHRKRISRPPKMSTQILSFNMT